MHVFIIIIDERQNIFKIHECLCESQKKKRESQGERVRERVMREQKRKDQR